MEFHQAVQNRAIRTAAVIRQFLPTPSVGNVTVESLFGLSQTLDELAQRRDDALADFDAAGNAEGLRRPPGSDAAEGGAGQPQGRHRRSSTCSPPDRCEDAAQEALPVSPGFPKASRELSSGGEPRPGQPDPAGQAQGCRGLVPRARRN